MEEVKVKKPRRRHKNKKSKPDGEDRKEHKLKDNKEKTEKERPNVFVALQVKNPDIHSKLGQIQSTALEFEPDLKETFVSVTKSHITLYVFNVDDHHFSDVKSAMEKAVQAINVSHLTLKLSGLSDFRNKVVYAKVDETEAIRQFYHKLGSELKVLPCVRNIKTDDNYEKDSINAHVTVMKTSRAKSQKMRRAKIAKESYSQYIEMDFGLDHCMEVQLLSMTKPPSKNGYYFKHFEIPFSDSKYLVRNSVRGRVIRCFQSAVKSPQTLFAISLVAFATVKLMAWKKIN